MSVLQAEFLAKSYKSRKVVSDVSLTVNSNEIVGQFEPDDIIELAQGEDVTARLVKTFSDDNWKEMCIRDRSA